MLESPLAAGEAAGAEQGVCLLLAGTPHESAERMLLEAGTELSRAAGRAQRRIGIERYAELVAWGTHLAVSRGLSHLTGGSYLDAVIGYCLWLEGRQRAPETATAQDVEAWQQYLFIAERQRAQTRRVKLVAVRRWYEWRERNGRGNNPTRDIQGPKKEQRMARKYSKRQLRAMLESCDRSTAIGRRDYAILLLFISTGARRMEAAGLTLPQLSLSERVGRVRFMGKGAKERMVSFGRQVVDALQAWFADRDALQLVDHAAVFVAIGGGHSGKRLNRSGMDQVIRRAFKRAGLQVEPGMALHVLRSTYATALYDAGHDIEQIRILMGHENIETTRRYIAISDRQLKTRLPNDYLADITGEGRTNELPNYAKQQLQQRGLSF